MTASGEVMRSSAAKRRTWVLIAAAIAVVGGIALAAWIVSSGPAGASSIGATMPGGSTPTVAHDAGLTSPAVAVSWSQATIAGQPVEGYVVQRYDTATNTATPATGGCGGVVTTTSCVEQNTPDGEWTYTITPRQGLWAGAEGAGSAPILVDTTAPTVGTPSFAAAVTFGVNPTFVPDDDVTVSVSATDAGSGVDTVSYFYCPGSAGSCDSATPWTFIGTSNTAAGGYPVTWSSPLPADGPYRVVAVATDNYSNSSAPSAPAELVVDSTPPVPSAPIVDGNS